MQHQLGKQVFASRDPSGLRSVVTRCSSPRRKTIYHRCELGWRPRRGDSKAPVATASLTVTQSQSLSLWKGSDDFTQLNDRIDAPPLPLPSVNAPVRVVIVRHGQSTWNADGRIQGSTDLSVLTEKGVKQAQKTRDMLSYIHFDHVFHSPLTRAVQTAEVVMQSQAGRCGDASDQNATGPLPPRTSLPALREIDLYQFQGLLKHEGKALYASQYKQWQQDPETFELGGHAPVRELWYRASLAWRNILAAEPTVTASEPSATTTVDLAEPRVILVVAHNAINQALVATVLGLPPSYFRRLPQDNAALSVLDFAPTVPDPADASNSTDSAAGDFTSPRVTLSCLNQSPENPFKNPDKVTASIVLLTPPAVTPTPPSEPSQLVGDAFAAGPSELGPERRGATGSLAASGSPSHPESPLHVLSNVLGKLRISHVLVAPGVSSSETIRTLLHTQQLKKPPPDQAPPPEIPLVPSQPPSESSSSSVEVVEAENPRIVPARAGGRPSDPSSSLVTDPHVTWIQGVRMETLQEGLAASAATATGLDPAATKSVVGPTSSTKPTTTSASTAISDVNASEPLRIWQRAVALAAQSLPVDGVHGNNDTSSYGNVLLVLDERRHVGVIRAALGLGVAEESAESEADGSGAVIRVSPGGFSVMDFAGDPRASVAGVRCINNTAHLGGKG